MRGSTGPVPWLDGGVESHPASVTHGANLPNSWQVDMSMAQLKCRGEEGPVLEGQRT